ncbi:MAG: hypothetical protein ACREBS_05250, partial [Nitrososphaerales archaeon]
MQTKSKMMKFGNYPKDGRFGDYGGKYVPETLNAALSELEDAYMKVKKDKKFNSRLSHLLRDYAGRPTPLYLAENLT